MLKHIIIATVLLSFGTASAAQARNYGSAYGLKVYHQHKQTRIKTNAAQQRISDQQNAIDRQKTNQDASQDLRRTGLDATQKLMDTVRSMRNSGF
jgi:hypothetical protein